MSKRKKLTDVEEFYVKTNPEGLSVDELANKLGCVKTLVNKIIEDNKPKPQPAPEPQPEPQVTQSGQVLAGDAFGRDKTGRYQYTIMTPAQSQRDDGVKKRVLPSKYNKSVRKIK